MKTTIILFLACFSTSAFAFPTVGDYATYKIIETENHTTTEHITSCEVKSVDTSTGMYSFTEITTLNGNVIRQAEHFQFIAISLDRMDSAAHCTTDQSSGSITRQVVQVSILGNTMHACRTKYNDGSLDAVMGNIPFGWISLSTHTDNRHVDMRLIDYGLK